MILAGFVLLQTPSFRRRIGKNASPSSKGSTVTCLDGGEVGHHSAICVIVLDHMDQAASIVVQQVSENLKTLCHITSIDGISSLVRVLSALVQLVRTLVPATKPCLVVYFEEGYFQRPFPSCRGSKSTAST